ncbi:cytochrome c biogenesis protein CcsA [Planctomycetota bacterium]|nr:cytochrome c biogenesis protein CcsA [Planctomycetota bacterium]
MKKTQSPLIGLFKALASLKLTVILFALAIFLVFAGTLAQRFMGNWDVVNDYFRSLYVWIPLKDIMPTGFVFDKVSFPFAGGALLGLMILVNLLAAFVMRFKLSRKRLGIYVIHLGLIMLIAGEFVTGMFAVESQMTIPEGSYANFSQDIRQVELAIVDTSNEKQNIVIPISERQLRAAAKSGDAITNEDLVDNTIAKLPFEVAVDSYFENAAVVFAGDEETDTKAIENPATSGIGAKGFTAVPRPSVTGVDTNQRVNAPAVYATIREGEKTETLLLSPNVDEGQIVEAGGKEYELFLRYKRIYYPFKMHLNDFRFDRFVGTNIARNYSSDVLLDDPSHGENRPVKIWMNHPLRYRGLTFFQASFTPDEKATVLQVVDNPGWTFPYIASGVISFGLLLHFGVMFVKHVGKRSKKKVKAKVADAELVTKKRRLPVGYVVMLGLIGLGVVYVPGILSVRVMAPSAQAMHELSKTPVTAEGRVKPLDSFARATLLKLSGKQEFKDDDGVRRPAFYFVLDMVTRPEKAVKYKVFRIDNPDIKSMLGVTDDKEKYFSIEQLKDQIPQLVSDAEAAEKVAARDRSLYQNTVLGLASNLGLVADIQALRTPYLIPPADGRDWESILEPMTRTIHAGNTEAPQAVKYWQDILSSYAAMYKKQDATSETTVTSSVDFVKSVNIYQTTLTATYPSMMEKMNFEYGFNKAQIFYRGIVLYVVVFLIALFVIGVTQLRGEKNVSNFVRFLSVLSVFLLVITFVMHTYAIGARIYITERPPVTNLYSSAVFVGWFAILLALILEVFTRNLIPTLAAAVVGFVTLIIAHNLATGDTMQMMQAVLDSNFWLTTHVIAITVGYSAVFLAGILGIIYIVQGVYTKSLTKEKAKSLSTMIYATTAFALLFSFVGTVLGGIWADQSWGRFWGWDTKENGAVLIVLITALILHARWGGLVQQRGIAVLAIAANIVCGFSWFGTNLLGVGLHSYGFMESGFFWLWAFIASQLAIMAVGVMPMRTWASGPLLMKQPREKKAVEKTESATG